MATVTITDDGATIKLVIDSITYSIPKPFIVAVSGTVVTIKQEESRWVFEFADVTSPVTASANALRALLEAYLDADPQSYQYSVALGRVSGATTWNKWGYNSDLDIGTEVIWASGGSFTRLDTASTFTVVSSSAQDTLTSGTGAWNVVIYYVDSTRTAATVVVPLNGLTPVVTSITGLGINRVALYNTGSGDTNAGIITVTATTGGSVQATVPLGEGSTQQCLFFTQTGHTALLDWMTINVAKLAGGTAPKVTIKAWVYSYVSTAKYLVFRKTIDAGVENNIELRPSQPFVVGEKSIFWLEATTDTDNTVVSARFSLIEVNT